MCSDVSSSLEGRKDLPFESLMRGWSFVGCLVFFCLAGRSSLLCHGSRSNYGIHSAITAHLIGLLLEVSRPMLLLFELLLLAGFFI